MERRDTPKGAHLFEWRGGSAFLLSDLGTSGSFRGESEAEMAPEVPCGAHWRWCTWRPAGTLEAGGSHRALSRSAGPGGRLRGLGRQGSSHTLWAGPREATPRFHLPEHRLAPPRPAPPPGAAEGSLMVICHPWEASGTGGRWIRVTGLPLPILCEHLITAQP